MAGGPKNRSSGRWHWGKIAILWGWGGLLMVLLQTRFLSQKAELDPTVSSISFLGSLLILGALTIVTWLWLGGKDAPLSDPPLAVECHAHARGTAVLVGSCAESETGERRRGSPRHSNVHVPGDLVAWNDYSMRVRDLAHGSSNNGR
jgi:hypothetical protein